SSRRAVWSRCSKPTLAPSSATPRAPTRDACSTSAPASAAPSIRRGRSCPGSSWRRKAPRSSWCRATTRPCTRRRRWIAWRIALEPPCERLQRLAWPLRYGKQGGDVDAHLRRGSMCRDQLGSRLRGLAGDRDWLRDRGAAKHPEGQTERGAEKSRCGVDTRLRLDQTSHLQPGAPAGDLHSLFPYLRPRPASTGRTGALVNFK